MSRPHHHGFVPPFPQLAVTLHFEQEHTKQLLALVDSGADVTLVPVSLLEDIGAWESESGVLRSQFGDAHAVSLYLVTIQVEDTRLPGVYVAADDSGTELILGRDVLNKLAIFLDGPLQETSVLDDATINRLRSRRK